MITFSIKDIHGVADCVCNAGHQLVFARFALHNSEELRGLRHAFQKEKWLTIGGEHYQLNKETRLWPRHQIVKGKGIGLWTLTAYLPHSGDKLFFAHDRKKPVAGQFISFLYQHTPYPVPPMQDNAVANALQFYGDRMPVDGQCPVPQGDVEEGDKITVYQFSEEKLIEILEALA